MSTIEITHARRSSKRVALILLGASIVLVALLLLVGGGALVGLHETKRDTAGFYASGFHPVRTPTAALVARKLDVGNEGPDFLFRKGRLGTFRVTATGTVAKPVFVGVARRNRVDAYLRGVRYDEVEDFDVGPFSVTTRRHPGAAHAAPPTARTLWAASATGPGRQSVQWHVHKGAWAVVVMNADGSPGLATEVKLGAKLPFLFWLGIGLATVGAGLAVAGAWLIVVGGRRRASTPPTDAGRSALQGAAS